MTNWFVIVTNWFVMGPWNPALPVVTADGWTMVWTVCRGLHGPHQPGDSLCHRWFDNNGDATVDLKDYSNWLSR